MNYELAKKLKDAGFQVNRLKFSGVAVCPHGKVSNPTDIKENE